MARRGLFRWLSAPCGQTYSDDSEGTLEGYSQKATLRGLPKVKSIRAKKAQKRTKLFFCGLLPSTQYGQDVSGNRPQELLRL
eukprot:123718-Pyramimonas_sp.AAC.1